MAYRIFAAGGLALALITAGCGGNEKDEEAEEVASLSGSACDSSLTYADFGKPFMEKYCTQCHSSALTGADRQGAPVAHDFDTEAGIWANVDHIDKEAAAGPNATNTSMPPAGSPVPSVDERKQLGAWLACGRADAAP